MNQVRCFVAIELSDELKQELIGLENQLKMANQPWVKWVDPHNMHLTLKFLGNVTVSRINYVKKTIEEVVKGVHPFLLEVRETGVFPNLKRVNIAWVGLQGELDKLGQLQHRIESRLKPLGFAPESRQFTPHLTLARVNNNASLDERIRFGQLIANTKFQADNSIKVDNLSLMRSQLSKEGAIYNRISLFGLKQ